jgi:hypothetical protein
VRLKEDRIVGLAGPVFVLFAFILVCLAARRALPLLLFSLSPRSLRVWFDNAQEVPRPNAQSASLNDLTNKVRDLGFVPLGLKIEKLPLWGPAFREVALGSSEHAAFASIVLRPTGEPASFYFYTPFEDGGMVFTRNFAYGRETERPPISVRNIPGGEPQQVLAAHEDRVRAFQARGMRPSAPCSQQGRIDATRAFYASPYARKGVAFLRTPDVLVFFLTLAVLILAIVAAL